MLSRENDLGIFKKQKGKYVWSSDNERRAWYEARLERPAGSKCLRFLIIMITGLDFTLSAMKNNQGC